MSTLGLAFLFSCILLGSALTPSSYLTNIEKEKLKTLFDSGFAKGFSDPQSVSLSVRGYSLLEKNFEKEKEACNLFKSVFSNSESINDLYSCAYGAFLLKSEKCILDKTKSKKVLTEIDKVPSIESLFKVVKTLSYLNSEIDVAAVKKSLEKFLQKDSTALNQAYSYFIASKIFKTKTELKKYFVEIEDTIQQADEAENIYMYYEEGIYSTSFILNSIFELSDKYEEAPPVSIDKLVKFSNFLMSRRHSQNLRAIVELTEAVKSLSRNKYKVPLVVSLSDNGVVHKTDGRVKVTVTNLWGDQVDNVKIVAETVKNVQSAATVMTRKPVTATSVAGAYELDVSQDKLPKGFYTIKFEAMANETRSSEPMSASLVTKVVSDVRVESAELSIKERDQLTGMLNYKLTMGSVLPDKLNMNWHHKLDMRFVVRDLHDLQSEQGVVAVKPHQVFVKMTHISTSQEIIFVVEADRTDVYKFSLDLEKSNKDFDNLSGDYRMELVLGDALLATPSSWTFATIKLEMPSSPSTESTGESRRSVAGSKRSAVNPRVGLGPSVAKPQIFHMFRPAEKRGGQLISNVFTVLCLVPPFGVMIVLWAMLGLNVANFQLGASSLLFHVGTIAIFGLYYCYWSYLNMFVTLQYLIPLGAFTAFFGNRVLRQIASSRKDAA